MAEVKIEIVAEDRTSGILSDISGGIRQLTTDVDNLGKREIGTVLFFEVNRISYPLCHHLFSYNPGSRGGNTDAS